MISVHWEQQASWLRRLNSTRVQFVSCNFFCNLYVPTLMFVWTALKSEAIGVHPLGRVLVVLAVGLGLPSPEGESIVHTA